VPFVRDDARLILFAVLALVIMVGVVEGLSQPICTKPKASYARLGAEAVAQSIELAQNVDYDDPHHCPTLGELVASKRLDANKTDDPWGVPFRIYCSAGGLLVWSNGGDGEPGTADDISSRMTRPELARAANAERRWYRF